MRIIALLLTLLASQAAAWEFTPTPICTLSEETPSARWEVTYDPATRDYAITIVRAGTAWSPAPVFAIRFDGHRGRTISTTRQQVFAGGFALRVTDRGFGNVLDGLEFNDTATAILGDQRLQVPLDSAAQPVQDFRACTRTLSIV